MMAPVPVHFEMPLHRLMNWSPFKIDALGLVTLIGADETNRAVGRLVRSRYTTFLPILGAYLVAGNQFTEAASGYQLYNLTDAITTTSISGWFGRWLVSQELKTGISAFEWRVSNTPREFRWRDRFTSSIGFALMAALTALTLLMGDYWGLANSVAMIVSVIVRWVLVKENLLGLDDAAQTACYGVGAWQGTKTAEQVKLLITLPDGKMVTVYAPRGVVINCITKKPTVLNPNTYTWGTRLGWLGFGIHVISLGQANLITQICTVALLVGSTWLTVKGFGCEDSEVGDHVTITRRALHPRDPDRRLWAYVRVEPTESEEDSMLHWGLLPRQCNAEWWNTYLDAKSLAASSDGKVKSLISVDSFSSQDSATTLT
jgi:hypothetical protein